MVTATQTCDERNESTTEAFRPPLPVDFRMAGLSTTMVESLILKYLMAVGTARGRQIAEQLGLEFGPFPEFLRVLKNQQYLTYADSSAANDFYYTLTESGRARARRYFEECSYVGKAPVPLQDYIQSVEAQSIHNERPREADLRLAFADLVIPDSLLERLGPAIHSGRGLFLYGPPGNGKTCIAERISRCFGSTIWIPEVIEVDGQILKLYDPIHHERVDEPSGGLLRPIDHDRRWVRIRRPSIMAGGEMTMQHLEIQFDPITKVSEAPLQLKSNNGTLLIDDFGRQRIPPIELLNRWIVPLEERVDYLRLATGKTLMMPFDQLILFSTNLEPRELVDEAFLRRIPYKILAPDPSEDEFRRMFAIFGPKLGFERIDESAINHLIEVHYRRAGRPFRSCQPRDLLMQVRNQCLYQERTPELSAKGFDVAVACYFTEV